MSDRRAALTVDEVRDVETIDQELRLLAAVRATTRELGGHPTSAAVDELLDERLLQPAALSRKRLR